MKYYKNFKDAYKEAEKTGGTIWLDKNRNMFYISCVKTYWSVTLNKWVTVPEE